MSTEKAPKNQRTEATCKKCMQSIISYHTYDFRICKCGAIGIDGGGDYTKLLGGRTNMWLRTVRIKLKNKGVRK